MRADGTILRQGRPETLDNPQRCPRSHPAARGGQSERRGARRVRARDIGARSRRDYRRSPPPRTRSRAGPAVKQHDCRRARCAPSSSYRLAWPPGSGQPHSRPQPQETRSSARSCGLEPRVWQLGLGRCPPQRRCLASGLRRVLNYLDARRGTATSETRSQRRAASHEPSVTRYDGVRVGVPDRHRKLHTWPLAVDKYRIGVPDAARFHADPDSAGSRRGRCLIDDCQFSGE
jgi:hypothetical protein